MLGTIQSTMTVLMYVLTVYAGLSFVNWVFGANNSAKGNALGVEGREPFSWKRLFKGIGKSALIYFAVAAATVGVALLPNLNNAVANLIGEPLFSPTLIDSLSVVGIFSSIATGLWIQATNAIKNVRTFFELRAVETDMGEEAVVDLKEQVEDEANTNVEVEILTLQD